MRRILMSLLICSALVSLAATPSQSDFIPLSSQFYSEFDTLMTAIGKEVNMTRPYTYGEAGRMVDSIDPYSLKPAEKRIYDYLQEETEVLASDEKVFTFDAFMTIQPEIYLHSNPEIFRDPIEETEDQKLIYTYQNRDKYMLWDREKPHLLDADLSLSVKDRVTLLFRVPVTNTVHTGVPSGSRIFMTNIPFLASPLDLTADVIQDFSMNFPYRAYISIADSWYSIQIGREQLNYGAGITGNFVIDSSLPYHNALSLSFFSETFKYTFLLSFFPHPSQYIVTDSAQDGNMHDTDLVFDQNKNAFTGTKMFMSHRFDWTMGNGRHRMAITEGIMYQNDKGFLDLQILNPMMFFHNMYIAGNSNSILQVEWDMVLAKGIKQHLALAIDDFNIPFEGEDGSKPRPNAVGLQYGINTSHALGDGFIEGEAEVTYISPYFYLRDGKLASDYPLDFVVAIRNQRSGEGVYDLYSIGYPNGGDQTIAHIAISYKVPFSYSAKLTGEYRMFGKNNLMTKYDSEESENAVMSHMLTIRGEGSYFIMENLEIMAGLEGRMIFAFDNIKDNFCSDVLFSIGMKYTL